mmetsp:Transcript_2186/g.6885  ORF Transcript_2186/g.6885 Transcript_2186/m.6885 type:complete len:409 (+) Transcript_2186:1386-2612(+)
MRVRQRHLAAQVEHARLHVQAHVDRGVVGAQQTAALQAEHARLQVAVPAGAHRIQRVAGRVVHQQRAVERERAAALVHGAAERTDQRRPVLQQRAGLEAVLAAAHRERTAQRRAASQQLGAAPRTAAALQVCGATALAGHAVEQRALAHLQAAAILPHGRAAAAAGALAVELHRRELNVELRVRRVRTAGQPHVAAERRQRLFEERLLHQVCAVQREEHRRDARQVALQRDVAQRGLAAVQMQRGAVVGRGVVQAARVHLQEAAAQHGEQAAAARVLGAARHLRAVQLAALQPQLAAAHHAGATAQRRRAAVQLRVAQRQRAAGHQQRSALLHGHAALIELAGAQPALAAVAVEAAAQLGTLHGEVHLLHREQAAVHKEATAGGGHGRETARRPERAGERRGRREGQR